MDRSVWLEERRKGIGGSDAAAILGLSRYRTAIDVWEEKLGVAPERPQTAAQGWGLRLEDALAGAYAEATGNAVRRTRAIRRARDVRSFPMIGSIDRLAFRNEGMVGAPIVLELKTRRADDLGSDDAPPIERVPPDWYCQVQHYMRVIDADEAHFAVLTGGSDFRAPIVIPRDEAFIADMVAEEEAFWVSYVETGIRPPVTGDDLAFLARRYPRDEGAEIVATPEQALLVAGYAETQDAIAELERRRDEARARIEDLMGPASRLLTPFGDVSWKSYETASTSWKAYAEHLEQLLRILAHPVGPEELANAIDLAADLNRVRSAYTKVETRRPFTLKARKEGK